MENNKKLIVHFRPPPYAYISVIKISPFYNSLFTISFMYQIWNKRRSHQLKSYLGEMVHEMNLKY